jgi:hypothetical protein
MQPIKTRHYNQVAALIRRDQGDQSNDLFALDLSKRITGFEILLSNVPGPVRPANPSLIPSADGAISRVLLTIPTYAVQDPTMAAAYQSLLNSLPTGITLVVLVQTSARPAVDAWLKTAAKSAQSEVNEFDDALNISIWAEEGMPQILLK